MLAAFEAACCAAKGVPLREPLKPIRPADDQRRPVRRCDGAVNRDTRDTGRAIDDGDAFGRLDPQQP